MEIILRFFCIGFLFFVGSIFGDIVNLIFFFDVELIEKARKAAKAIFKLDPDFSDPEHQGLAEVLKRYWSTGRGEIS